MIFTFLWIFTYELIAKIVVTFTNRYADTEGLTQKDYLCSMEYPLINFDSIEAFNNYYGLPTCNSFVSVFDLSQGGVHPNKVSIKYNIFVLYLKQGIRCTINYGRQVYDYMEGTVVSFSPGQLVKVDVPENSERPKSKGIAFMPELIYGTPLQEKVSSFTFLDFTAREALHLSADEKETFEALLNIIKKESERPTDSHSKMLLSSQIFTLLEYLHRFYDRQFATRHQANSHVVKRFERELKQYYSNGRDEALQMPSVSMFAEQANLSPGYFGELVKRETGLTAKDIITNHLVLIAKHRLASTTANVAEIAYSLGFEYPAHFTRLFKRVTGISPSQFRKGCE